MSTEQMRQAVISVYPGSKSWAFKVKKMTDPQVVAIFRRMQNNGQIKL